MPETLFLQLNRKKFRAPPIWRHSHTDTSRLFEQAPASAITGFQGCSQKSEAMCPRKPDRYLDHLVHAITGFKMLFDPLCSVLFFSSRFGVPRYGGSRLRWSVLMRFDWRLARSDKSTARSFRPCRELLPPGELIEKRSISKFSA